MVSTHDSSNFESKTKNKTIVLCCLKIKGVKLPRIDWYVAHKIIFKVNSTRGMLHDSQKTRCVNLVLSWKLEILELTQLLL